MSDPASNLADAHAALERAERAVTEHGEDRIRAVLSAHRKATDLLDRYEGRATGTGDFQAYVEFQNEFVELVEGLGPDVPEREAFVRANEHLDQRRLSEDDFERVREMLEPAGELASLLTERDEVRERYEDAHHAVERRKRELDSKIDDLERLQRLGAADLDAPVERLRDPVTAYNDAVRDAFESFLETESAREVFAFVEATDAYPLVEFRSPPPALAEYVESHVAGAEPIPTLLEYADYSTSKLDHYVDDPAALKTRVAVHRTYLNRLDASPLTVSWPPPEAGHLRYRAQELVSVLGRFAPDSVVERARTLQTLPDDVEYERLRQAAQAMSELDEADRERLESGDVAESLRAARERRDELAAALEKY